MLHNGSMKDLSSREKDVSIIIIIIQNTLLYLQLWNRKDLIPPNRSINPYLEDRKVLAAQEQA